MYLNVCELSLKSKAAHRILEQSLYVDVFPYVIYIPYDFHHMECDIHFFFYISLLIIPCIIYYVTNKETLNLEPYAYTYIQKVSCCERQDFTNTW